MPVKLRRVRQAQIFSRKDPAGSAPSVGRHFGSFAADLLQVYRDALSYDAQYAAARATAEAGREKQPQALAGLLPTIGATGNTFWNDTARLQGRRSPAGLV
jgi:outer membrane protein TolC